MKITHRNPTANWFQVPESDPVDPDYEAEVERHTGRSEREYQRRAERLARAEARLAKARSARHKKPSAKQLATLVALVELRRTELEEYRRLMTATAASTEHRGKKSFRPVPTRRGTEL